MFRRLGVVTVVVLGCVGSRGFASESRCLRSLRQQVDEYSNRMADLDRTMRTTKFATSAGLAAYAGCVAKFRSIGGAIGCAFLTGSLVAIPYEYRQDVERSAHILDDSLTLLEIYDDSAAGEGDRSEAVQNFVRKNGVRYVDENAYLETVRDLVDSGQVCSSISGRPTMTLDEIGEQAKKNMFSITAGN